MQGCKKEPRTNPGHCLGIASALSWLLAVISGRKTVFSESWTLNFSFKWGPDSPQKLIAQGISYPFRASDWK